MTAEERPAPPDEMQQELITLRHWAMLADNALLREVELGKARTNVRKIYQRLLKLTGEVKP